RTADEALARLRALTGRPGAQFHPGQLEAIAALVDERRRALVVQSTGWGKSAVYFVATALLRSRGAGPTLLVSPLLALMRDQVAAAERAGVRAAAINSATVDEWESEFVATALLRSRGAGPTLLVSPLLALMRDQVAAAERAGVRAAAINSATVDEWESVLARLVADDIDVLLVS